MVAAVIAVVAGIGLLMKGSTKPATHVANSRPAVVAPPALQKRAAHRRDRVLQGSNGPAGASRRGGWDRRSRRDGSGRPLSRRRRHPGQRRPTGPARAAGPDRRGQDREDRHARPRGAEGHAAAHG
jgi:hypothetical protein